MKVQELFDILHDLVNEGYGEKDIFSEGDVLYEIDSIQKDTHPKIEANYFFIMAREPKDEEKP